MKKMNNKGYMIVEIIVASVLAMTIAYFLFDLVIKLKEKYDYVQTDTILTADKTVITNEILGDLYTKDITKVYCDSSTNKMTFEIKDSGGVELSYIYVDNPKSGTITYQKSSTDTYKKKLNNKLQIPNNATINCKENIASFIIETSTLTSKKNYNINIIIPVSADVCDSSCT